MSFLVVGQARRVQVPFPLYGETRAVAEVRLREALVRSAEPGPDLIWEVHALFEGRFVPARTTPARDAFQMWQP